MAVTARSCCCQCSSASRLWRLRRLSACSRAALFWARVVRRCGMALLHASSRLVGGSSTVGTAAVGV